MTILHVHLFMLAFGLICGLFIFGLSHSSQSGSAHPLTRTLLAPATVLIFSLSPMLRFWREGVNEPIPLLAQSFLLVAIGLLSMLLVILLRKNQLTPNVQDTALLQQTQTTKASNKTSPNTLISSLTLGTQKQHKAQKQNHRTTASEPLAPVLSERLEQLIQLNDEHATEFALHTKHHSQPTIKLPLLVEELGRLAALNAVNPLAQPCQQVHFNAANDPMKPWPHPERSPKKVHLAMGLEDNQAQFKPELIASTQVHEVSASHLPTFTGKNDQSKPAHPHETPRSNPELTPKKTKKYTYNQQVKPEPQDDTKLATSRSQVNHPAEPIGAEPISTTPHYDDDTSLIDQAIDFDEIDQLYAALREQPNDLELPSTEEWLAELQHNTSSRHTSNTHRQPEYILKDTHYDNTYDETIDTSRDSLNIEDAQLIDSYHWQSTGSSDDTLQIQTRRQFNTEFGNSLGEYALPKPDIVTGTDSSTSECDQTVDSKGLKTKLNALILKASEATININQQLAEFDKAISKLKQESNHGGNTGESPTQQKTAHHQNTLLSAEEDARHAAELVIAAQNELVDKMRLEFAHLLTQLDKERETSERQLQESQRNKALARRAASLARKAAVAQQSIREAALRERSARIKSQEATRKALYLAKNAISALSEKEREQSSET